MSGVLSAAIAFLCGFSARTHYQRITQESMVVFWDHVTRADWKAAGQADADVDYTKAIRWGSAMRITLALSLACFAIGAAVAYLQLPTD